MKYLSRPKRDGLWVRLKLQDGAEVDGTMPTTLLWCQPWDKISLRVPTGARGHRTKVETFDRSVIRSATVLAVMGQTGKWVMA